MVTIKVALIKICLGVQTGIELEVWLVTLWLVTISKRIVDCVNWVVVWVRCQYLQTISVWLGEIEFKFGDYWLLHLVYQVWYDILLHIMKIHIYWCDMQ